MELVSAYQLSDAPKVQLCGKCTDGWVITNPQASPADYVMRRCECVQVAVADQKIAEHICDDKCKRKHGRGYHSNDVLWLWKKRRASEAKWKDADYAGALSELDRLRQGGAPAWRT